MRVHWEMLINAESVGPGEDPDLKKGNIHSGKPHLPVGHPNSGVVCGSSGCVNPGVVWLLDWEETEYQKHKRIFELTGRISHVKLTVQ